MKFRSLLVCSALLVGSALAILPGAIPAQADPAMKMPHGSTPHAPAPHGSMSHGAMPHAKASAFSQAMHNSMAKMNKNMMAGPMTGNPDRDFATMMIAHHQGAIDMAQIQLRYGKDPVLRRLAQQIITDQRKEIAVMQNQLKKLSASKPSPKH